MEKTVYELHLVNTNRRNSEMYSFTAGYYADKDKVTMLDDIAFYKKYGFTYFLKPLVVDVTVDMIEPANTFSFTAGLNRNIMPISKQLDLLGLTKEIHYIAVSRFFPELQCRDVRLANILRVIGRIMDNEAGVYDTVVQGRIAELQSKIMAEVGTTEMIIMTSVSNILLSMELEAYCSKRKAMSGDEHPFIKAAWCNQRKQGM